MKNNRILIERLTSRKNEEDVIKVTILDSNFVEKVKKHDKYTSENYIKELGWLDFEYKKYYFQAEELRYLNTPDPLFGFSEMNLVTDYEVEQWDYLIEEVDDDFIKWLEDNKRIETIKKLDRLYHNIKGVIYSVVKINKDTYVSAELKVAEL